MCTLYVDGDKRGVRSLRVQSEGFEWWVAARCLQGPWAGLSTGIQALQPWPAHGQNQEEGGHLHPMRVSALFHPDLHLPFPCSLRS
jgi:hypothetical protein